MKHLCVSNEVTDTAVTSGTIDIARSYCTEMTTCASPQHYTPIRRPCNCSIPGSDADYQRLWMKRRGAGSFNSRQAFLKPILPSSKPLQVGPPFKPTKSAVTKHKCAVFYVMSVFNWRLCIIRSFSACFRK